jgi:hypothetical protein
MDQVARLFARVVVRTEGGDCGDCGPRATACPGDESGDVDGNFACGPRVSRCDIAPGQQLPGKVLGGWTAPSSAGGALT